MRKLIFVFVFVLGFAWTSQAKAWGPSGHRTVCEIAFLNLTPTARAEVTRLLSIQHVIFTQAPRNRQFGWSCTYPDYPVNGGPQRRGAEHFVNYARTLMQVVQTSGCGAAAQCVITAIRDDFDKLRSTSLGDADRMVALIYLGHWFGDIHQPLHSSYQDDTGGNDVGSASLCVGKLHWTWDSCVIQQLVYNNVNEPSVDTVQTLAANWNQLVTSAERAAWVSSEPWQWSAESYAVTIRPDVGYCVMVGPACQYDAARLTFDGRQKRTVDIDADYQTMAMPIIEGRILRAGIRLAHYLNRALDPAYHG
jgi:hypothetical protein